MQWTDSVVVIANASEPPIRAAALELGKTMSRPLILLRPRSDSFYLSKNRTVLATDLHGMVGSFAESGLFVYQTRMLSSYRYFINGQPPRPLALSNVHQNTWMGYYIMAPPGVDPDSLPCL